MTRGVTLIECLMYMTLLSLLTIGSHAAVVAVAASTDRTSEEALVLREAMFLRERIRDEMRESERITESGHGLLVVAQEGGREVRFELIDRAIVYRRDGTALSLVPAVDALDFTTELHASSTELRVAFELGSARTARRFSYLLYL